MLTYLFDKVLFLSLAGSAVIFLLLLLGRIGGKSVSHSWRFYSWIIPMFLLVLPITPLAVMPKAAPSAMEMVQPIDRQSVVVEAVALPNVVVVSTKTGVITPATQPIVEALLEPTIPAFSIRAALPVLWLCGMLVLMLYHKVRTLHFRRYTQRATVLAEQWETAVLDELRGELHLKKAVALRRFHGDGSPFLCGSLHPTVYLPQTIITEGELRQVLTHELIHCKRHDLLFKGVAHAIRVLHWFNPLAWVMEWEIGKTCEFSCDEAVVQTLPNEERKAYGLTILRLMKHDASHTPAASYLAERELKNRLEIIMNTKRATLPRRVLALVLVAVLTCTGIASAAAINGQNPNKNNGLTYATTDFTEVWYSAKREQDKDGNTIYHEGDGIGHNVTGSARITNLPGNKAFSADVVGTGLIKTLYGNTHVSGSDHFTVEMTTFVREVKSAGEWVGRFTVKRNGVVVLENEPGVIENVPSLVSGRITRVRMQHQEHVWFCLDMNFGLVEDEEVAVLAEEARRALNMENMAGGQKFSATMTSGSTVKGSVQKTQTGNRHNYNLFINHEARMVDLNTRITWPDGTQFTLSLANEQVTSYKNGVAIGTFTLRSYHDSKSANIYDDYEVPGTVSGLNGKVGDIITVQSDDGTIHLNLRLYDADTDPEDITKDRNYTGGSKGSDQARFQEILSSLRLTSFEKVTLNDSPFAVTYNRKGVTFRYVGKSGYHWAVKLANTIDIDWERCWNYDPAYAVPGAFHQVVTDADVPGGAFTILFPNEMPEEYTLNMAVYNMDAQLDFAAYDATIARTAQSVLPLTCQRETMYTNNAKGAEAIGFIQNFRPCDYVFGTRK